MASADAAEERSPASTPRSSAVYSTSSTTALTLDGLSRQNSASTLLGLDETGPQAQQTTQQPQRPSIHRVSSEQLLPTPSELTASALLATNAARATSMIVGKVTSRRRQRNPRRFVVTELPPEQDEFLSEASSASPLPPPPAPYQQPATPANGVSRADTGDATTLPRANADGATPRAYRPSKMEVRGRFTIIDLSPDSPETSSQPEDATNVDHAELPRPVVARPAAGGSAHGGGAASRMRRAVPPRRFSRGSEKGSSMTMASAAASAALPESSVLTAAMLRSSQEDHHTPTNGNGMANGNGHHYHPPTHQPSLYTPQLSPHGVDLNALDRHLVFLQQESLDMKAVLESMISSNARWISALASSPDSNVGSGKNPKAVHPASSPLAAMSSPPPPPTVIVPPPVVQEPTLEEKYEKLLAAHGELQQKYDTLASESAQLKRSNLMLETRLRQETSVNEELRAHVDQLTQYTESLIYSVGDPPLNTRSTSNGSQAPRRKESLSSTSTEVLAENDTPRDKPAPQDYTDPPSKSAVPMITQEQQRKRHDRAVSVDSAALWATDNNQFSGLEDDDDSNFDSDGVDPRDARALKALRRRRWRNVSRSTSMSLEDDSASSVYSGYRDSWVSLFDPQHSTSQTSDWRAMSYDGADSSVGDVTPFENSAKANHHHSTRHDSTDSGLVIVTAPSSAASNNQVEDEAADSKLNGVPAGEQWARRRKSSVMIVEELEDNPAETTAADAVKTPSA